ncbi:COX15-CtaA-domain-containing protein [Epithele typhae]|uniref:COX15-CtaA-domain-containing protein n=1 Tax=Epithele typhae TaxID=378194 RepID=UPI0020076BDD|nr:COX15-CtaA-domain-containing protein [Epithele typhae]KAH9921481.1 COX15-CtaA-domain-containing protein [Epithele typhae]
MLARALFECHSFSFAHLSRQASRRLFHHNPLRPSPSALRASAPSLSQGFLKRSAPWASSSRSFTLRVAAPRRAFDPRFFSSNAAQFSTGELPVLSPPAVGGWLLASAGLVFAVIVVGGVTRLTESGLSITEWKPITGVLPPLGRADWEEEFNKYKATPEFKLLNHAMTIDEFKNIFYMEWGHRVLGRIIGVGFVVPLAYFALRKRLTASLPRQLFGMALLIGAQGALGWYMVKSGLEDALMDTPGAVPRVSQYRLAAHLGTALVLYAGMFGTGLAALMDWRFAHRGAWSGTPDGARWQEVLASPLVRRFGARAKVLTGLVLITALSGAFVAGLDAGLLYNEFPLMGGRLAPPADELFDPAYAKRADKSDLWWRSIFENPTTVQFDHRCLAITTYVATTALYWTTRRPALAAALPPLTKRMMASALAMVNVQALLGICTLLYLVPVPLAAAHQAGSVALLTTVVHLLVSLGGPAPRHSVAAGAAEGAECFRRCPK